MTKRFTKYEHHIPQFILRTFLKGTSYRLYDVALKKFRPKGASNSMGKDDFYEHHSYQKNEVENILQKRETLYADLVKKLLVSQELTLDEYKLLVEFRHISYYRSNEFIGFHTFGKSRGKDSWMQRHDWRSINGIYSPSTKQDLKKTQLDAIKRVVNGKDEAFLLSLMTPVCFLYHTKDKKFILSDTGSIGMGEDQFNGMVIIVISPNYAIGFPRMITGIKIMGDLKLRKDNPTILPSEISNELVDTINSFSVSQVYQFYIDPNS